MLTFLCRVDGKESPWTKEIPTTVEPNEPREAADPEILDIAQKSLEKGCSMSYVIEMIDINDVPGAPPKKKLMIEELKPSTGKSKDPVKAIVAMTEHNANVTKDARPDVRSDPTGKATETPRPKKREGSLTLSSQKENKTPKLVPQAVVRKSSAILPPQQPSVHKSEVDVLREEIAHLKQQLEKPNSTTPADEGDIPNSAVVEIPRSTFGIWRDGEGKDLPCLFGAGPGEIVMPDNMNPWDHVIPVKACLDNWLYVRVLVLDTDQQHPNRRVTFIPRSEKMDDDVTAAYGMRAFKIFFFWALEMLSSGTMIPVLDFVKERVKKMDVPPIDVSDMLAPFTAETMFPHKLKAITPPPMPSKPTLRSYPMASGRYQYFD